MSYSEKVHCSSYALQQSITLVLLASLDSLTWWTWNVSMRCGCCWKTKQKRELVGKTERTATDKLRERRLKKRRQKSRRLQKEKREKLKEAEKTARLGSMKNLMDAVSAGKQKGKNKNKNRHSVSHMLLSYSVLWRDMVTLMLMIKVTLMIFYSTWGLLWVANCYYVVMGSSDGH